MKSLAVTGFNRPEYFKQAMENLRANDLSEYSKLYIGLEPGNAEMLKEAQSIDFIDTDIHINPTRLKGRKNAYETISRALRDNDAVLYIEDDIILSPDATVLANWFFENHAEDYMALCMHNMSYKEEDRGVVIGGSNSFTLLGSAFTKETWEKYMAPAWFDQKFPVPCGTMNNVLKVNNLKTCHPLMSRSKHIGREKGVHYRPAKHDKVYTKVIRNEEVGDFDYSLVTE